jgi:hypothetical protein
MIPAGSRKQSGKLPRLKLEISVKENQIIKSLEIKTQIDTLASKHNK